MKTTLLLLALALPLHAAEDILIADFEGETYAPWTVEGTAFGTGPAHGTLPRQMRVEGFRGHGLVNSFNGGDRPTGKLTSPEFTISRKAIAFLIGGGGWPGQTCMNLLIDGKMVRTATGPNTKPGGSENLEPGSWDVSEFAGKKARLEIVDNATGGWGHINVDHIILTDTPAPKILSNVTREVTLTDRLLNLPVRNGAPKRKLQLLVGGEPVREIIIELADDKPDYWTFTDVSEWKGQQATLTVDKLPESSAGLKLIEPGDELKDADDLYHEALRPQFHFSSKRGWINDPNGLAFYHGEYQMFYQHSPQTWGGSAKHWGHAVSRHLIHWDELPTALYPDAKEGQMYSGSGVVDGQNTSGFGTKENPPLVLIYTGTGIPWGQCLAYSTDARTIKKYDGNPVVPQITPGNRDPKVIWHEPTHRWIMALYVGHEIPGKTGPDGKPARRDTIQFLASPDLKKWNFQSEIEGYYECPDLFPLALHGDPAKRRWILTAASSDYQVGQFDGKTFTPETPKLRGQRGNGLYAAQTFSDQPEGRRIQIGWGTCKSPGMPFNQMMNFPCELTLHSTSEGPRVFWQPIKELALIRGDSLLDLKMQALTPGKNPLEPLHGDLLEITAEIEPGKAEQVSFNIRGLDLNYDVKAAELTCATRKTPLPLENGRIRLQMLVDRTSLEIFGNGGLVYMPMSMLPKADDHHFALTAKGGEAIIHALSVRALKSIWPAASGKTASSSSSSSSSNQRPDLPIGLFDDNTFGGWKRRIAITQEGPQKGFEWQPAGDREHARGVQGEGYISTQKNGPEARGSIVSPPFKVERRYINFLLGGTRDLPSRLGATLYQGDKTLNCASASDEKDPGQKLYWRTWDVSKYAGQQVAIRVSDRSLEGWIAADSFVQSDRAAAIPTLAGGEPKDETFRPQFHYTPLAGWMNDANGCFYYGGVWHLCHQYRAPGQAEVGWGHAISNDLLHWVQQDTVLPPRDGVSNFSGSAAVDWYNISGLQTTEHPPILLCYTRHPSPKSGEKATQALAFSTDGGQTFTEYAGNPVLRTRDFNDRDPRLFFHAPSGAWNMVLSLTKNNTQRDLATYGIFRSWDLNHWYLAQNVGPGPWYWECPDMFELPIAGHPEHKTKWILGKGSGDYIVGEFDGEKFTPESDPIRTQFGGSYYGAQTFSDAPNGRHVQIAWMNSGPKDTTPNAYPGMSFNQQMSFPRELTLRLVPEGYRIFREPVREISQLYQRTVQLAARPLIPGENGFAEVPAGKLLDLEFTLAVNGVREVNITLGGEPVRFDPRTSRLTAFGRTMPWPIADGLLRIRALLDRTSLELFGNDGELTHSGVFFHDPATATNNLSVEGGPARLERLVFHELESIWE